MSHILATQNGYYYTGRAGEGWLSPFKGEAFTMGEGEAKRKAETMNRMTPLHRVEFSVEAI